MTRFGLALWCAVILAGCPAPENSADDFTGQWTGVLTGNYNCADGTTAQVIFTSEEYDISQSGTSDSISVAFCNGLVIDGTASGDELDVTPSQDTSLACTQTDNAGNTITINDFSGGSFTFDGSNLDVSLDEDVALTDSSGNSTTCSGTATGTLSM